MPYKRFKKTIFKKVRGRWTKKKIYRTIHEARKAMKRLRAKERGPIEPRR
ncbi:MAG: hypothetical protein ACE5J0_02215 [Candidatus Paceibacterales bacterium]